MRELSSEEALQHAWISGVLSVTKLARLILCLLTGSMLPVIYHTFQVFLSKIWVQLLDSTWDLCQHFTTCG